LIATVAFALVLPPVGSPAVHLADDVVALAVFAVVVAGVLVALVAGRFELLSNIEDQRRLLLRTVSHDLRTPLATIAVASSELTSGAHVDDAGAALAQLIEREVQRLDRLVANLLSLNRIEAGALELQIQAIDVADLVGHVVSRHAQLLADVRIEVDVAPDLPVIRGDFALLEEVLTNLLENAVRHSPPDAVVHLTAAHVANATRIDVVDEGTGILPHERDAIFEPFRSGTNAGVSGIGLAICQAVVRAHHGTISASGRDGGGARFTIVLPI
jgi:two-component system sensor histidine kinase KdpD